KKKVRWSMNSRQGSRYIKTRMGNELKNKILVHNGIIDQKLENMKITISNCPRCELINAFENKYCSKCSYPIKPEAYDEIKDAENNKIDLLEKKCDEINNTLRCVLKALSVVDEKDKVVVVRKLIKEGVYSPKTS